jgi:uncharacterized protein (TIGR03086 family)
MTDTDTPTAQDLPLFPVPAPALFSDPDQVLALLDPVLADLAGVVAGSTRSDPAAPTPCNDFDVAALRDHLLGWLQQFANALADPDLRTTRPDPAAYRAADDDRDLGDVVGTAATTIDAAVRGGVLDREVAMSQARMTGPSVLGMTLGEYLLHGWDLATATGQPWQPPTPAVEAAHAFFAGMIAPEYRGGDAGFFAEEVAVPAGAPALDRLLGFAGRDPAWQAPPR